MTTVQVTFYVDRGGIEDPEVELLVSGTVSPYRAAQRHGPPEMCSPAEGGEAEITAITCEGAPWTGELTTDEEESALEKLGEQASEHDYDGPEWDEGRD